MSGQPPPNQQPMRSSLSRGPPSPIHYRPPSPWAPSPPPIISGPRRPFNSPGAGQPQHMGSPMSPPITNYNNTMPRSQPMSPMPPGGASGLRGTRGTNVTQPRPRWPGPPHQSTPPPHPMVCPSPPTLGGANGPRPYRPGPMHSYSPGPMSSFQLSPTPSPVVCQTPSDYMYSAPFEQPPRNQYEYAGVPPEPPKSYIIYDDEEDQGPSTAEIIANQSQDYVDEKLAEYQMTILQLQELIKTQNAAITEILAVHSVLMEKIIAEKSKNLSVISTFPITSEDQLKDMNNAISDENRDIYVLAVKSLIGSSFKKNINRILPTELIIDYNVDGSHGKKRFKDFDNVYTIIKRAIELDSSTDDSEGYIRKAFQAGKKNTSKRCQLQGKGILCSSTTEL